MFNTFAHAAIDAVQTSKKTFVDTFVKHEGIRMTLNSFVDSQTAYTKSALDAGLAAATNLGSIVMSKNFYDDVTENMKAFMPTNTKKAK